MSTGSLSHQVEAYYGWKKNLIRELARYQDWLQSNDLYSDDIASRLQRGLKLLQEDELTLAFVGEYSRGKTELINALFFSEFGQRMLPSQAGRTTMCPTELFYDRENGSNYLKLLPIESRKEESTLAQLTKQAEKWTTITLDITSPETMKRSLDEVAKTHSVTVEEAKSLGFHEDMLDHDPQDQDKVIIPAWRHAQISMQNPLLERGLRILDTPGLNALGSEPELTISMIPNAHAVIFLLSADTGVTASDLTIWKDYITTDDADHRAGRFAVLNKIDVLWDDLQGDDYVDSSIQKVRQYTADHLDMEVNDVLPLSAKQALIGKVKGDHSLYEKSALPELERLISGRILAQKEQLITKTLINDILGMLQNSQAILSARTQSLNDQLEEYEGKGVNKELLKNLTDKTQQDYDFYYKKLITLRSSRRLMKSQGEILQKLISEERLEEQILKTRDRMKDSWTTIGMNREMGKLFDFIDHDLNNLSSEARLAEKMVQSIYKRYTEDTRARHLHPKPFVIAKHVRALRELKNKATSFRRDPRNIMTEQTLLIKRFFDTLVAEARLVHNRVQREALSWPDEALLPIMQYTLEQKQLLEHQIRRIKDLSRSNKDARSQREQIQSLIDETQKQLMIAESIQRHFRKPAPTQLNQKVVSLTGYAG